MKNGFDSNVDLTRFGAALKNSNYSFVGRYYNQNNPSKNLTLSEAHFLSNLGLSIVAVWENGFPTSAAYFSHAKGVADGTAAYAYANHQITQPPNTPIYFAVDYDASAADVNGPVMQYFQGIRDGFNAISQNNPVYQIGGYGSGLVCSTLQNNNLVQFTWLAQSMGWAESRTYKNYNLVQALEIRACPEIGGGVNGDPNTSPNGQEGAFQVTV